MKRSQITPSSASPSGAARVAALLVIVVALLSGCNVAANPASDRWAVKIDGETISAELVTDEVELVTSNPAAAQDLEQQLATAGGLRPGGENTVNAQYTSNVVYTRMLATLFEEEVRERNIEITPALRESAEQRLRQSPGQSAALDAFPADYRNYLINRQAQLDALLAARATPESIAAYYEANRSQLAESCVRHILVQTPDQAAAARARIVNGEDFASVANDFAAQQGQPADGGELGCFADAQLDRLVQPFADAVRRLQVNELSQPVQTNFGFHVIEVTRRNQPTLEQATPQIREQLGSPTELLFDLLQDKDVTVNPRFGEYIAGDRATNTPGQIVPLRSSGLTPDPQATEGAGGLGGLTGLQP